MWIMPILKEWRKVLSDYVDFSWLN